MTLRATGRRIAAVTTLLVCVGALLPARPARAGTGGPEIDGAYTLVLQTSDEREYEDSATGSVDVLLSWPTRSGRFEAYIEGNSTIRDRGIASLLPRSNADAGSTLDSDRNGRVQVSELKYTFERGGRRSFSAGLIDPSAYLDSTRVANDENVQFIGASFVNNATIEFPDYTLGIAAHVDSAPGRSWTAVLTSSNGIADNPNLSYSQLLSVSERRKGLFAATETAWAGDRFRTRVGAWLNTADHEDLAGSGPDRSNHGVYGALGSQWRDWSTAFRVGAARPEVSLASAFASFGTQREFREFVLGFAASHTWISSHADQQARDSSSHFESYMRFRPNRRFQITPSVQYLVNGGFDVDGSIQSRDVMVVSLRLHHVFAERRPTRPSRGNAGR